MKTLRPHITTRNALIVGRSVIGWAIFLLTMHAVNLVEYIMGWPWWVSFVAGFGVSIMLSGHGFPCIPSFKERDTP